MINPLIEEDRMSNLKRLTEDGASGPLYSTFPSVIEPAPGFAMATGANTSNAMMKSEAR